MKSINKRMNLRYNQFCDEQPITDDNKYKLGFRFTYGYDNEQPIKTSIKVLQRYESLKEELTTNKLSTISAVQFNIEYKKAEINFNSDYRRERYEGLCIPNILS
eukprot:239928_1